jgi:hypothetical protein
MKHFALSLFGTASFPFTVLLALTAGPARLYAETAPPPPACIAPEVEACAARSSGEACAWDGGMGTCESALCMDADSGTFVTTLACRSGGGGGLDASSDIASDDVHSDAGSDAISEPGSDDVISDAPSDAGGEASAEASADASDANSGELEGGMSGVPTPHGSGSSCSAAGGSSSGASRSMTGLLLATCVLFGARRRASSANGGRRL